MYVENESRQSPSDVRIPNMRAVVMGGESSVGPQAEKTITDLVGQKSGYVQILNEREFSHAG